MKTLLQNALKAGMPSDPDVDGPFQHVKFQLSTPDWPRRSPKRRPLPAFLVYSHGLIRTRGSALRTIKKKNSPEGGCLYNLL